MPLGSRLWFVVVVGPQNPVSVAFGIVKLASPQGPEECQQTKCSQSKRHRNEENQHLHQRNLIAFSVTRIEDVDMAKAAARGVANPASANGTAIVL